MGQARRPLDLSTWRMAFNGAEPVRAETLERFAGVFGRHGFRRSSLYPCYGLAESTLLVSGGFMQDVPRVKVVDATALAEDRSIPARHETKVREVVSCGHSWGDQDIRIVDPLTAKVVADGRVGEVWVRGPSVAQGYWGNVEASRETFGAELADGTGPFLRTGDLGFLEGRDLFVTGRLKDLIILNGRNVYPHDVERAVERASPSIRPGGVAAFALEGPAGERLAIVAEVDRRVAPRSASGVTPELSALLAAIRTAVTGDSEVVAERIVLVRQGSVPKTSSGKVRRRACRELLMTDQLSVVHADDVRSVTPPPAPESAEPGSPYVALAAHCARLDRRETRYRFSLEDVPWDRIDEPGLMCPHEYLGRIGVDVDVLRARPEVDAYFQAAFGILHAEVFAFVEEILLRFTGETSSRFGTTRSLILLEEEEAKHIDLFRRFERELRRRHPSLGTDLNARLADFAKEFPAPRSLFDTEAEYLYEAWLSILMFEIYSIYIHEVLDASAEPVNPTWLAVNALHRREEHQHVLTDLAYLKSLDLPEPVRYRLSKSFLRNRALDMDLLVGPLVAVEATQLRFPDLPPLRRREDHGRSFAHVVSHRLFAGAREVAPYLTALIQELNEPGMPGTSGSELLEIPPDESQIAITREFVSSFLARHLGVEAAGIDPRKHFSSELGLNSVTLIGLTGTLEEWLGHRLAPTAAYDHPTVELLARHAASVQARGRRARDQELPATSALPSAGAWVPTSRQRRLIALDRAHPGKVRNHITVVWELLEPAAPADLQEALSGMLRRHETLRTRFRDGNAGPIAEPVETGLPLAIEATSGSNILPWEEEVRRIARRQDGADFDLSRAPLMRATLVRGERSALVLTLHHLITDGWSTEVLYRELRESLKARQEQRPAVLPRPALRVAEVAAREHALIASPEGERRLSFWRDRLASHPRLTAGRPSSRPYEPAISTMRLDPELMGAIVSTATSAGTSPFIVLLAAFQRVLSARSGERDLLVQCQHFHRPTDREQALVGYLVNLLTLRVDLSDDPAPEDLIQRTQAAWLDAIENELPISTLVHELRPDWYTERVMPARAAFNMLPIGTSLRSGEREPLRRLPDLAPPPGFLFFDHVLVASPSSDGSLGLTLWHDRSAVSGDAARAILDDFAAQARWMTQPLARSRVEAPRRFARIGLIGPTIPSHLNAMATLGRELARRGHEIVLVGLPDARPCAERSGFEFAVYGESEFPAGSMQAFARELGELSAEKALEFTVAHFRRVIDVMMQESVDALRRMKVDALLVDHTQPASTLAEVLEVPFVTVCIALPFHWEPDVPPWMTPWPFEPTAEGRARNARGMAEYEKSVQPVFELINGHRRRMGLRPLETLGATESPLATVTQQPAVFDFPRRGLRPTFHYTGPFRDDRTASEVAFPWEKLDGRPLIYASLGTLQNRLRPVFEIIAAATAELGVQTVISLGQPGAGIPELPGSPLVVPFAPQVALLERSVISITHGGLNSVLESLALGVPVVAIPIANEQPGIAARARHLGVGELVLLPDLTVDGLRETLERVLGDTSYRERARMMSRRIGEVNGPARAADIVDQAFRTRQPVLRN